jgi:hypothetical protein
VSIKSAQVAGLLYCTMPFPGQVECRSQCNTARWSAPHNATYDLSPVAPPSYVYVCELYGVCRRVRQLEVK